MIFANNRLGKFIRNGRLDAGLTQEQLAEKLDCNLTHIGNIERGKNMPSLKLFCSAMQELSLSADEFIYQRTDSENRTLLQLNQILSQCTPREMNILLENARTLLANRKE